MEFPDFFFLIQAGNTLIETFRQILYAFWYLLSIHPNVMMIEKYVLFKAPSPRTHILKT